MSKTTSFSFVDSDMDFGNNGHLIVVSNRLPITITKDADGEYHFKMSSGGLVSALSGFKKFINFTWIGWPGFFIPPKDRPLVDKRLMEEYSCQAVYLDDDVADRHYNGFSNSILWPLFHYHPGEMNFDEENWLAYRQANLRFAEAVRQQITPGAMVWVQDYHLMLLPMLLRGLIAGRQNGGLKELSEITEGIEGDVSSNGDSPSISGIKIGFFLHTPFPSSEIYRYVTQTCGCFPTPDARQNIASTERDPAWYPILRPHRFPHIRLRSPLFVFLYSHPRSPHHAERSRVRGPLSPRRDVPHRNRACVFHQCMSLFCRPTSFTQSLPQNLKKESVQNRITQLEQRFGGVKVIVGVDRLDYIKGVPQKLHALELFLTQHPEWIGKVCAHILIV
jgi:trehalose 6-phosphate synthase